MVKLYGGLTKLLIGMMIFFGIIVFNIKDVYGEEKTTITNLKVITGEYIESSDKGYYIDYFSNENTISMSFYTDYMNDEEKIKDNLSKLIITGNNNTLCGKAEYDSRLKQCVMTINLNEGENNIKVCNENNTSLANLKINYKKVLVEKLPDNLCVDDNFNVTWKIKGTHNYRAEWYGYGIDTMLISKNGNITIVNGGKGTAAAVLYDGNNKAVGHIEINISASGEGKYGWVKNNGKWYYIDPNTKCFKIGWIKSNNNKYFINNNGEMAVGWIDYKGVRYYLAKDGTMKSGFEKIDGKWYYFNKDGSMRTGWLEYNNNKYYFTQDGIMVTGNHVINGKDVEFKNNGEFIS